MSLLPDVASFEERVVDCFCALRGGGHGLSALDRPVLAAWAASGVPFEVVARGLRLAAQKAGYDAAANGPVLRSLRATRRTVDAEIRRHQQVSTGAHRPAKAPAADPWARQRRDGLLLVIPRWEATRPMLHEALHRLASRLSTEPPDAVWAEDLTALSLLRALPHPERRRLWRRAQAEAGTASSAMARRLSRRTRLFRLVCEVLEDPAGGPAETRAR